MKKQFKIALLSSFCLLTLASCGETSSSLTSDASTSSATSNAAINDINSTIVNALPNLYVTLAQLGAIIVLVIVFIKFGYQPIKKRLETRKAYVSNNLQDSETRLSDAKRAQEIADSNVKASRTKANQIIDEAHQIALADQKKMMDQTEAQIELKQAQADKDIAERKELLERENHNKIVATALDASKEILGREVNQNDNEKIVDDFIEKMKKDEAEKK
jgi:F-type H+-transporting ATPase subunit b